MRRNTPARTTSRSWCVKQADGSDIIYELERRGHPYRAGDRVCIFPKRMSEAKLAERLLNLKVGRLANSVGPRCPPIPRSRSRRSALPNVYHLTTPSQASRPIQPIPTGDTCGQGDSEYHAENCRISCKPATPFQIGVRVCARWLAHLQKRGTADIAKR
jgi:hypothetical protein